MILYDKRPMRWRDVPRQRDDVFLPVARPIEVDSTAAVIEGTYRALLPALDERLPLGLPDEVVKSPLTRRHFQDPYLPGGRCRGRMHCSRESREERNRRPRQQDALDLPQLW